MAAITTDPEQVRRITTLWRWVCEAYGAYGVHLRFPKNTDPRKTYQWRYLVGLAKDLDGWEFDEPLSKRFIQVAAKYAHEHRLLTKGLAIFRQANLMEILCKQLERDTAKQETVMEGLARSRRWFDAKLAASRESPTNLLLTRPSPGAFCNLVTWYRAGEVTDLFLALSQECGRALARMTANSPDDRSLLPTSATLYLLRSRILKDVFQRTSARDIMKADWCRSV
jgi:hypothetical protein